MVIVMKKALIAIGFILVLFIVYNYRPYLQMWAIEDNINLDKETNAAIKELVYKAISVQYGHKFRNELDSIFTKELQEDIDSTRQHFYWLPRLIIFMDKEFMHSIRFNENGDLIVDVNVEDLSHNHWQVFTIIKQSDGSYIISKIEFDH